MNKNILEIASYNKPSISQKFYEATKIKKIESDKTTPYSLWPEKWKKTYYKAYPRFKQVLLTDPRLKKYDLLTTLFSRKSTRKYSSKKISLSTFSDLLFFSFGMKNFIDRSGEKTRFYPSAGARYPLEIYPIVQGVKGIRRAVYHYHVKSHSLEEVLNPIFKSEIMKHFSQSWIRNSAVILVITAVFDRTQNKYKDRGYRHILTEYGHLAQNVYLLSTALKIGCCSIGGFVDDGLNTVLDIDGASEGVIGVIVLGKPKTNP